MMKIGRVVWNNGETPPSYNTAWFDVDAMDAMDALWVYSREALGSRAIADMIVGGFSAALAAGIDIADTKPGFYADLLDSIDGALSDGSPLEGVGDAPSDPPRPVGRTSPWARDVGESPSG